MTTPVLIGIHGLLNKPAKAVLEGWWRNAIVEGLARNHATQTQPAFSLCYWADVRNPSPILVEDLGERYEAAPGQGPLARYDPTTLDKTRAFLQKWGGRMLDKEKDLIGLGTNVEKLLGVGLQDLDAYYGDTTIRQKMRSRLSALLESHKQHTIMLIAHSMGSVIAYDVLRTYDASADIKVAHLITIGSPLGLPLVAYNARKEFGAAQTPRSVLRWTNFSDPRDKVALDCDLVDDYKATNGVRVVDVLVRNEYVNHEGKANCHKSYGYLRAAEVSDRIREFLVAGA